MQRTLAGHGRLIPSGSCPTVGVAGLTSGGGLGADTRSAGLTCDALLSASVVLPGGELVTANPDDHAECVQWYAEPSTPETTEVATAWPASAHQAVKAHSVGGYVNYLKRGTAAERNFGDNPSRLAAVRSRYAPHGLMGSGLAF